VAWEETRGTARVSVGSAHRLAHADDAKSRADEASRLPVRSLPRRMLAGAGLAVLALVAFLALRGGDGGDGGDETGVRAAAEIASPSVTPGEPSPAELLAQSLPTGSWRVVVEGDEQILRNGTTSHFKAREVNTWTFPVADCSDSVCAGTVESSSERSFPFTWNGRKLDVTRPDTVTKDKKRACIDQVTGQVMPIDEAAARVTYHYAFGPFTGTGHRMTSKETTRLTYEFFGTCHATPNDTVSYTYKWTMTPVKQT
jgi:hypothetical protein